MVRRRRVSRPPRVRGWSEQLGDAELTPANGRRNSRLPSQRSLHDAQTPRIAGDSDAVGVVVQWRRGHRARPRHHAASHPNAGRHSKSHSEGDAHPRHDAHTDPDAVRHRAADPHAHGHPDTRGDSHADPDPRTDAHTRDREWPAARPLRSIGGRPGPTTVGADGDETCLRLRSERRPVLGRLRLPAHRLGQRYRTVCCAGGGRESRRLG